MPRPLTRSEEWWEQNWRRHHRAHRLRFRFSLESGKVKIQGDNMQFTLIAGQIVSVIGSPVDIAGNPSKAVLSNQVYTSSDPSIFTVAADPGTPGGAIITALAGGTATLLETALATEPDGTTTENIQGVATIIVTPTTPPPPPVAAAIAFTFGTPTTPAP
jgi:hypothetical protein